MSSFTNSKSHITARNWKWYTSINFKYYFSDNLEWEYIEVDTWFEFDGCSIPICIFWQKVEANTISSCCLHDWLFKNRQYSLLQTNRIFRDALFVESWSKYIAYKYWLWVTLFGWFIWYIAWESAPVRKYITNKLKW